MSYRGEGVHELRKYDDFAGCYDSSGNTDKTDSMDKLVDGMSLATGHFFAHRAQHKPCNHSSCQTGKESMKPDHPLAS